MSIEDLKKTTYLLYGSLVLGSIQFEVFIVQTQKSLLALNVVKSDTKNMYLYIFTKAYKKSRDTLCVYESVYMNLCINVYTIK